MYPQFFGFDKLPFRLRPDPEFLYSGQEYLRARAQVLAALQRGPRIVLLMGPPGVGKTLLLEDVLGEAKGQFSLCRINQPHISATELLQAVVMQLGTTAVDTASCSTKLTVSKPPTTELGSHTISATACGAKSSRLHTMMPGAAANSAKSSYFK
jgi:general secretion pathway protein A